MCPASCSEATTAVVASLQLAGHKNKPSYNKGIIVSKKECSVLRLFAVLLMKFSCALPVVAKQLQL